MKTKPSETLRQMALTSRNLSWLGAVAETVAELEEDNARKDDAIAEQARKIKELLAQLMTVKRERDAAVRDIQCTLRDEQLVCAMCNQEICPEYGNDKKPLHFCDEADWRGPCPQNGGENA